MDRDKALEMVRKQLPEKRYVHTLGVVETALRLSEKYGGDAKKIELASIFHDYAKYLPDEEMREIIVKENLPRRLLRFHRELWHAPVGACLVKKEAGIEDEEILNGIRYHTTGRANMTLLEKIVFLADYIEPGRNFPGVDPVRKRAEESLDGAVLLALEQTISFLLSKHSKIYPDTIDAYNDLIDKCKGGVSGE
jgi:predicted HD superfamily hydrolase involved in NAD metabolism